MDSRGFDPVCGDDLRAAKLAALQEHLSELCIIARRQVQPAQGESDILAIGHIDRSLLKSEVRGVGLVKQLMQGLTCRRAEHHRGNMRIDGDIFPALPCGDVFTCQLSGIVIHRSAKAEDAAHIVDVGFGVHIVFIERNTAGHVQNIPYGCPFIGRAFERGGIVFYFVIERFNRARLNGLTIKPRHKGFRDRPTNAQVVLSRTFAIALMDNLAIFENDKTCCVQIREELFKVSVLTIHADRFRQRLNIFRENERLW